MILLLLLTSGGAGGGGCFELSSLVLTKENNNYKLKKMGDVRVGDIVLTIDPVDNYKLKELEVEKLHIHDEQEYEILELITQNSKIRLTPNHPLIIDENNNIKKAGKIKIGEKILVYNDGKYNWEEIKEIKKEIIKDRVMTIELKDQVNTFLVSIDGKNFILAHSGYSHINLVNVLAFSSLSLLIAIAVGTDKGCSPSITK
ncbi:MAG: Hint domain-containing protein [bacterium]